MQMPRLTEEGLRSLHDVLEREIKQEKDKAVSIRLEEIRTENPILFEWLIETVRSLRSAAVELPENTELSDLRMKDPRGLFIPLNVAEIQILLTAVQLYKAIKAKLEILDLEGL